MTDVQTFTNKLETNIDKLDQELTDIKNDMTSGGGASLNNCPSSVQSQCNNLKSSVSLLDTVVDFSKVRIYIVSIYYSFHFPHLL